MKKHNLFKGLFTALLALVLVAGTFAASAKAATVAYVPKDDKVEITADDVTKIYYAVIKEDGAELKASNFKTITKEASAKAYLSLGKNGLNIAENKDAKIVILDTAPAEDKTSYNATITIKGTNVKKVNVSINYAALTTAPAASAKLIDTEKNETNATAANVYYSTDGGVNWNCITGTADDNVPFDGTKVADLIKKGAKVSFKVIGTAGTTNERGTKTVTVSVKAQKALKSVKVDYVKGTIAIKNGYDYQVVAPDADPAADAWITVLPYNKNGSAPNKTENAKDYVAVKFAKDGSNASSFTSEKVANMKITDLTGGAAKDIYVRVSAGVGKAATKAAPKVAVAKVAAAPTITVTSGVYASSDAKNDIKVPAIAKAADSTSASPKFEYLVVSKSTDLDTLDATASKWTAIAQGGKINAEKAKSTVVLTDGSKSAITASVETYILVREQAVKGKSLASAYVKTKLVLVPEVPAAAEDDAETPDIDETKAIPEHYDWKPETT